MDEHYYRFTRLMKDVGFTEELSVITKFVASLLPSIQQLIRFQLDVIWPSITYVKASIIKSSLFIVVSISSDSPT